MKRAVLPWEAARFHCQQQTLNETAKENVMTTLIENRKSVYARPAARFDADGGIEVRASAVGDCRRALWYAATGHNVVNPPAPEVQTVLEAGNALEPVVLRAMERAGWEIAPANPHDPQPVSVPLGPMLTVTGHPDAVGSMPVLGGEMVVEVKTRNPEAFKRWRVLGAERGHPSAVAQAAVYTHGLFGEARDAVIACMDTGSRRWDYEIIPAERVARALSGAAERLGGLAAHLAANGPDPDALPDRDFDQGGWQCRSCPFLAACRPGMAAEAESEAVSEDVPPIERVSDDEARKALHDYEEAAAAVREFEEEKRWRLDILKAWLAGKGVSRAALQGREKTRSIGLVATRRYTVDHRRLNALLDPETRAEVVAEQVSEYLRVS